MVLWFLSGRDDNYSVNDGNNRVYSDLIALVLVIVEYIVIIIVIMGRVAYIMAHNGLPRSALREFFAISV